MRRALGYDALDLNAVSYGTTLALLKASGQRASMDKWLLQEKITYEPALEMPDDDGPAG